ncbi:T9SS type A sorting domain-containing protein [Roseivirga pacifica]|uniref:T9SS type A sorting domain-containing protein n=1 Tax=Roseivirga pacifica TaxID=1267423 RepID=UPI003BA93D33
MRKKLSQKYLIAGVVAYVLFWSIIIFLPKKEHETLVVDFPEAKAEMGEEREAEVGDEREDLQSRYEYEQQMLANPQTGVVPQDMRSRELTFAKARLRQQYLREYALTAKGEQAQEEVLTWRSIGPNNFGGRTRAFALDVLDENIWLAGGVTGGMWRSTDAGASWQKMTQANEIQSVTAVTQDIRAGKENIWYYGTGELVGNSAREAGAPFRGDGLFKSTDGGLTWQPLTSTQSTPTEFASPFQYVWDITTDPNSADDVVMAAVFGGIVRSEDGGLTWETVLGVDLLDVAPNTDLNNIVSNFYTDIHRTSDGTFYASISDITNDNQELSPLGGVYKSTDGINWDKIVPSNSSSPKRRTEIGSSAGNPDLVYLLSVLQRNGRIETDLYRYNNATGVVTNLSANMPSGENDLATFDSQGSYNTVVAVHPTDPNLVVIGGTNLYKSTDGFTTAENVSWIGGYDPDQEDIENGGSLYENHHPDQHGIAFLPSNPNVMISANDGGIFKTDDVYVDRPVYQSKNNGYKTTQFYTGTVSQFPTDNFVLGGTQDNGSILTYTNDNIGAQPNGSRVIGGDGAFTATTRLGIYYYMSSQNSRIFRLTFNEDEQLTSFARVDPVGGGSNVDPTRRYLFINPFVLDPSNQNRMYLAGGEVVWRNRNLSQVSAGSDSPTSTNWSKLERTEIPEGVVSAVSASTKPDNIVYYGTSGGRVYRIDDASTEGYSVTDITAPDFIEGAYVRSIAINPENADEILVSFSNYGIPSIYSSTDGGLTYTDVSGSLEENLDGSGNGPSVRWVNMVPKIDGTLSYYAATSTGLYSTESLNGQSTVWEQESPAEIGNSVVNMVDYRRSDGQILAATHGNGLFVSQIDNVEPDEDTPGADGFEFTGLTPNPFSDFVTISFNLPETDFTLLRIYDSSGRMVHLNSGSVGFTGQNEFYWDGVNVLNQPVPNGIYLIRLTYRAQNLTKRVILSR